MAAIPFEDDVGTQSQPRREEGVQGGRGRSGVLSPVDVNEVERGRRHGRFPKPQWPSGIIRKSTGYKNWYYITWKGTQTMWALSLNLEERKGLGGKGFYLRLM